MTHALLRVTGWWLAGTTIVTTAIGAQSLADRVNAVRDGRVLMSFPARPGVCGDGSGSVWTSGRNGDVHTGRRNWTCENGPVRVAIGRADNQTVSVRTHVGGRWLPGATETNLGEVSPAEAARYLVSLARTIGGSNAGHAISAAAFADGVDVSPELASVVRDNNASLEARKQALFWLGQGDAPTSDLVALYQTLGPSTLREHYTFVLSQRQDDAALDKLIDIATHDPDHDIRKRAMFWLGQSHDPKAIKFFADILTR
jgi:hypothetical protein